ncbi:MAG: hypothetical protein DMG99_07105 [Acidobacteria bacterium]|nr:MAG: hypothetical protein DMG99_07105 [Acidobacteriota bacterium]
MCAGKLSLVVAFDVVSVGGGGARLLRFGFPRLLAGMKAAGTETPSIFHIVVFGKRRDHGGAAFDLADAVQDDLRAAIVHFYRAADLDVASGEQANITHILKITGEDYDGERTGQGILAEIQEVNAFVPYLHLQDFSADAFSFADVFGGFMNGEAVSGWERTHEQYNYQRD